MKNNKTNPKSNSDNSNNKKNQSNNNIFPAMTPQDEYAAENEWYWKACLDEEKYEDHFH